MVTITKNIADELEKYLTSNTYDRIYVLTDENTQRECLPLLQAVLNQYNAQVITIDAGDVNKDIRQVAVVWETLSKSGASRKSLLINLGGGMITDLGGFAGATFKRGIHTLNIPTTLMSSVDAAIGGKTGVNFNGLKNEIGAFYMPDCVIIDCCFLRTLDGANLLSGYAEMIKHGLISEAAILNDTLKFEPLIPSLDIAELSRMVEQSVAVKARIVAEDPKEQGIRKALNFGHTVGHAIESLSFAQRQPLLHGHAVAVGIVCELYLSYRLCGFPSSLMTQVVHYIKQYYPPYFFTCNDYETLFELMTHDKKNHDGNIRFALLSGVGAVHLDITAEKEQIYDALDFYRESFGI
jgi:3-dehydroquinate synthase